MSDPYLLTALLAHQQPQPQLSHVSDDAACVCARLNSPVCLHVCDCVYSWPSPGHQPGEEQAVPGREGRLLGGGESAGPAG